MSVVAIINPISGAAAHPERAQQRVRTIREEAARRGLETAIHVTEGPGHAREIAREAAASAAALVIVWGGDGTMNEASSALLHSGTPIGLVPAGSGNGLAAALGIPHEPRAALGIAFDSQEVFIDAGTIGGRSFLNIAGVGIDARIARLFNERAPGARGAVPYAVIGVREGCRYASSEYLVELDNDSRRVKALLVAFANGCEYGNGACIAPAARLDDGLLEAVVIDDRPVVTRFWHARHLATRSAHRAPGVTITRIARASIESTAPLEVHIDGESFTAEGRLDVSVLPRALRVKPGPAFRPTLRSNAVPLR